MDEEPGMKVLHCLHDYLPEQVAGVEVYTNRLARRQAREHRVGLLFAELDPGRRTGDVIWGRDGEIETFSLAQNQRWARFERTWRDPRLNPGFRVVLDRFAPDIVHVHHLLNLGTTLVDEVRSRRIPLVMTLHDHWWACANGGQRFHPDRTRCDVLDARRCARCTHALVGPALALRGHRRRRAVQSRGTPPKFSDGTEAATKVSAALFRRVRSVWEEAVGLAGEGRIEARWRSLRSIGSIIDAFIAPSLDILDAAVEFGLPAERVMLVRHGFPEGAIVHQRSVPDVARRFGYVGSLVPHKGVHILLRAFDDMPPDATLDIHGSVHDAPEYVRELRRLARHPGIRLRGERDPDRVRDILERLDCLVVPSLWRENAPLSIQEAFAAGTPVIASDLGGIPEQLSEGGGLLFEAGRIQALHSVLLRVARERGLLPSLAHTIPRVRSMQEHVADLDHLYRHILRTTAKAPCES